MTNSKSSHISTGQLPAPSTTRFSKALIVANRIGLHPKTIHRWAAAGLIQRYKINDRVVLFAEDEVQRFIESAQVNSIRKA
jgi:hypothetical protein